MQWLVHTKSDAVLILALPYIYVCIMMYHLLQAYCIYVQNMQINHTTPRKSILYPASLIPRGLSCCFVCYAANTWGRLGTRLVINIYKNLLTIPRVICLANCSNSMIVSEPTVQLTPVVSLPVVRQDCLSTDIGEEVYLRTITLCPAYGLDIFSP